MSEGNDIHKMTRAELNDYAGGLGIADAAEMANKDEVLAAIEAAHAEQDATDELPTSDPGEEQPPAPPDDADAESDQSRQRYFLLKAVTVEDGTTYMPGESVAFGPGFTSRRINQLIDQKYLRPLE